MSIRLQKVVTKMEKTDIYQITVMQLRSSWVVHYPDGGREEFSTFSGVQNAVRNWHLGLKDGADTLILKLETFAPGLSKQELAYMTGKS